MLNKVKRDPQIRIWAFWDIQGGQQPLKLTMTSERYFAIKNLYQYIILYVFKDTEFTGVLVHLDQYFTTISGYRIQLL